MTQLAVEALLRQKIGLDAAVFAGGTVAKAVQSRMAKRGITEIAAYLNQLHRSAEELAALIEAVVVPETWFFRDKEPFVRLQAGANEWIRRHPGRALRVLSLPCSTGEEAYSIAIALLEAGLSAHQFQIDAIDISHRSLQLARQATYDKHSFRGTDPTFQERYFTRTTTGYCLREAVRRSVRFQQGNIVDLTFAIDKLPYDIIFCRNLLIYFDRPARERTLQVLDRLLTPQGLLFVGHAETALLPGDRFIPVRHPFAFAYRKAESVHHPCLPSPPAANPSPNPVSRVVAPAIGPTPPHPGSAANSAPASRQPEAEPSTQDLLSTARVLANQGCLLEAVQQCQAYLNQHRTSAEAYVLLGQVQQAMGQELQAEQSFQKALYLNPKHLEALTHLALLLEQQGELNRVATLRQRIQRLV